MRDGLPHTGDVVVQRQVHSPAVYVLSTRGGPVERAYKTYEEALGRAIGFARKAHLDAWYTTDGQVFERLSRHRL